jgi:hypothetical protein
MARVKITLKCEHCGKEFEHIHMCRNSTEAGSYEVWARENCDEAARDLMRKAADDAGKPFEIWFTAYRADRLRRYFSLMYSADAAKIETIFSENAASKIIDALR